MPQYFIHVHGEVTAIDCEGMEFVDLEAAQVSSIQGLREIIAEDVKRGVFQVDQHLTIADESGETLVKVTFEDAVKVKRTL
jgi:hypothetical protein